MAGDGVHEEAELLAERSLDPFGLVPDWRSKIAGLGGSDEAGDLNYVAHTHYVPVAEGNAHFRLRFHALRGKLGSLNLRVHMYQKGSADARLATSERILLSRLIQLGGVYELRFEAFHDVTYALVINMDGMTDAAADGLEVVLDRPIDESAPQRIATEGRNSDFGRDSVKSAPSLISAARATLADPVSQRCTAAQLGERVFREWSQRLGEEAEPALDQWCAIYVLQVLSRYGVLVPGAVGLGIGAAGSGVAALAAAAGATVEVADRGPFPVAAERLRFRPVDLPALPRDLVNFDFLWSERVASRLGSPADGVRFADQAMRCLRPGGLAVHVVDFALSPDHAHERPGIAAWQRREFDRLALILISRGHDVAEIKVDEHRAPVLGEGRRSGRSGITAAGLIVRKARTVE